MLTYTETKWKQFHNNEATSISLMGTCNTAVFGKTTSYMRSTTFNKSEQKQVESPKTEIEGHIQ